MLIYTIISDNIAIHNGLPRSPTDPDPPLRRQAERYRRGPHPAGDALPEPAFEHRFPGNEGELAALLAMTATLPLVCRTGRR